jgi:putative spermidine/putrescine transport system permease protein
MWCAVPAVVFLVAGFAYPVGNVLARAFTDRPAGTDLLANFSWYFSSSTEMDVLRRTFIIAAAVAAICLVVCYPFAYVLTVVGRRWRILLLGIVVIAAWQSLLVRTFAWKILLRDQGPLNDVLGAVGAGRVSLLGETSGVTVAMCQIMAPFMIFPLYASMRTVDRSLLSAAQSLGASPARAFTRVFLPLSLPGIVAGSLLVFLLSLGFYITPAVLGSQQDMMVAQSIDLQVRQRLDWGHAGAMSVTLLGLSLVVVGAVRTALRRRLRVVSAGAST